jgi:glycosyltransferase involved in cell wall biosynthesis
MPRLSSITITGNEAANIADCLDSLSFCDERVVVDGGSKDDTVAIAEKHGGTVYRHAWTDHGTQKNIALSHATGDWVLLLDADERVSPALAAEIKKVIEEGIADGYEMPRLSNFCGRWMWHSGWYPDYVLRLFRREKGCFSDHLVHERVICRGTIARLKEPLTHFAIRRIHDSIAKMDSYSTSGAIDMLAAGRKVKFSSGITHGLWAFFNCYFFRLGFLDGREGFLLAVANAEGTYYRYMKAWLQRRSRD